jgi:long-chain acyl-CoA synthetase
MFGFRIGYSSGDIKNLIEDIRKLRPTIFGSFPMFFSKIYNKIKEQIECRSNLVQTVIDHAIQTKIWSYMKHGTLTNKFYDAVIFKAMKNVLGGRIRLMISGGAPL